MTDYDKQIEELQEELANTRYNKATERHIGILKAKIAKLREQKRKEEKKSKQRGGGGYAVRKQGDATVIMLGFPSVGKSTLLNSLTNAESEVGGYDFTTLEVVPGMMPVKGAKVQILDVPGIVEGASSGKGRGKEVLSVVRNGDLCILMVDVTQPEQLEVLKEEAHDAGIRLDSSPPRMKVHKREKGGLDITFRKEQTHTDRETLKEIAREMDLLNADIIIHEDITVDRFIDGLESNKAYMDSLVVLNKKDLVSDEEAERVKESLDADLVISAKESTNLDSLKQLVWDDLDLIRVYMKEPGEEPDMDEPLVLDEGSTIRDACNDLHRTFTEKFKFARVTGPSSKFPEQKVSLDHELMDEDVLELHLR